MTNDQINIAIAEACGWKTQFDVWTGRWSVTPNYCNDLNAMHEAEESLSGEMWADYFELIQKTGKATGVRATARQRAKAFLITIGKWK